MVACRIVQRVPSPRGWQAAVSEFRQGRGTEVGWLVFDRLQQQMCGGYSNSAARMIGMRAKGEAKIAIANNQLIPLPEPARRGLLNLGDDLIATANQAVAAAALLDGLRCAPTLTV